MWLRKVLEVVGPIILLMGWFVIFYSPSQSQPYKITNVVIQGFRLAQDCYPTKVTLDQFQLNIVPGDHFFVMGNRDIGFGLFRRIFVADEYKNDYEVWAHEFIHGFGVIGHPKSVFGRCDL